MHLFAFVSRKKKIYRVLPISIEDVSHCLELACFIYELKSLFNLQTKQEKQTIDLLVLILVELCLRRKIVSVN